MFEQNDKRLQPIARWGCYFCSLGAIAEQVTGKILTEDKVMNAYADALCINAMGWNCFVKHPEKVLYFFLSELGIDSAKVSYIGWWNANQHKTPAMFGSWKESDATHEVLRYKSGVGHHFRLKDFDPWPELNVKELTGRRLLRVAA